MKRLPFAPAMFEAAFIDHCKTVTRRLRKGDRPYYKEGEIVRAVTTWATTKDLDDRSPIQLPCAAKLRVGREREHIMDYGKVRPGRHVPKFLEHWFPKVRIVSVRLEMLHDITADDAILEGATMKPNLFLSYHGLSSYHGWSMDWSNPDVEGVSSLHAFVMYWDRIHGPGAWDKNPPVWRVEFEEV